MKRSYALLTVPVLCLGLTSCSQIDALAPVGGAAITSVRNATYDVLVDEGVEILVAPQCNAVPTGFTCEGSTVDGLTILAEASADAPYELTISIDGKNVFQGTAQEVLEAAVMEAS